LLHWAQVSNADIQLAQTQPIAREDHAGHDVTSWLFALAMKRHNHMVHSSSKSNQNASKSVDDGK